MGNNSNKASTVLNQALDLQTNVINTNLQQCIGTNFSGQSLTITANNNSTILNTGSINLNQIYSLDINCAASTANSSQVISDISVAATQAAKSVAQNASFLTVSSSDAKDLTNSLLNIGTTVVSKNVQNCMANAYQSQQVSLIANNNSVITNSGTISLTQTNQAYLSCIQDANNTANLSTSVTEQFDQVATAITQNAFALIIIAVIIIVVLLFSTEILAAEILYWKTLLVILFFILAYIALAYFLHIWPFHAATKSTNNNAS